jgi:hypothetical protein
MSTYYWQTPLHSWPTDTVKRLVDCLDKQLWRARANIDLFSPDENLASEAQQRILDLKASGKPYWEELQFRRISQRMNRNQGIA